MAAPTKAYGCASCKAERVALLVHDFEIAFDTHRTIIDDSYFRSSQESLRCFL